MNLPSPFILFFLLAFLSFSVADPQEDRLKIAQKLFYKGEYYKSSLIYEEILKESPKLPYYIELSKIYRYCYFPKKMKATFEKGLTLDPKNFALRLEKAKFYKLQNEHQKATELLTQLLQEDPKHFTANIDIATSYIRLKEAQKARKYISLAAEINPDSSQTYQTWAKYHFRLKKADLAINYCWYLLDNYPPKVYPLLKLGNGWNHSANPPELALIPKNPSQSFKKAYQLYHQGKYEKAKQLFTLEKKKNKSFENYFFLGCIALHQKEFARAERRFKRAFEVRPQNARNLNAYGIAKSLQYRQKQAIQYHSHFQNWGFPDLPVSNIEDLIPHFKTFSLEEQKLLRYTLYPFRKYLPLLIQEGVQHHIIDFSQRITSIPELSYMEIKRSRSFDGRLYQDIRGVGGENAVTSREDIWMALAASFNTFAHEFAHQIMEFGFSGNDIATIRELYSEAQKEERFLDDYAGSNPEEYFAQGYEAYISFFKRPWSGITYRNTRQMLKEKDPKLFQFISQKIANDFNSHPAVLKFIQTNKILQQDFE